MSLIVAKIGSCFLSSSFLRPTPHFFLPSCTLLDLFHPF
jgi:hypothetical protein